MYRGLNRIANIMGCETDAYRSTGTVNPLERSNRYLRLLAAFSRADGNFAQSVSYGVALWRGHFDASYSRVGDYLVQDDKISVYRRTAKLTPGPMCQDELCHIDSRQTVPTTGSSSDPVNASSMTTIISQWPASLLGTGTEGKPPTHLPGDTIIPNVIALLPSVHGQIVQPTDIVTDENGSNSIVVAAELSDLGWRLNIRQVST